MLRLVTHGRWNQWQHWKPEIQQLFVSVKSLVLFDRANASCMPLSPFCSWKKINSWQYTCIACAFLCIGTIYCKIGVLWLKLVSDLLTWFVSSLTVLRAPVTFFFAIIIATGCFRIAFSRGPPKKSSELSATLLLSRSLWWKTFHRTADVGAMLPRC